ncbi:MAG TPA: sigma-70 family RNA polymerase sigma factor [Gaiellaceae bacterium]|nr:sigma-70 family RNA polymerase sigma factor [Gaiellaceae bacterium]
MGVPSAGRVERLDRLEAPRDDGRAAAGRSTLTAELTDAALVARCREGDDEAWRELVDRFSRYVYAIAVQGFRLSPHDAEDVFQDVFARVYERLDSLRDDDAVRPWIAQLTRRLCIDRMRSGTREAETEVGDLADQPADDVLSELEEAFDVHEALAELPEHCRVILDRFFAQDESYRTIGDSLSLPAGTIASRISRCLDKLRTVFEGRNNLPLPSSEQVT